MNCSEWEQLLDAYLDDQLAGSLRLEFDAHRLRCRHCQQTLAMLETVGSVVASDPEVPDLSGDFTERVMTQVEQMPRRRWRPLRIAMYGAGVLQVAAVVMFAFLLNARPAPLAPEELEPEPTVALESAFEEPDSDAALRAMIIERLADRLGDMHAAGETLTEDFTNMAGYLNIMLPDDVARETENLASVNPWSGLWDVFLGPAESDEEPETEPTSERVHSL